MTDQKWLDAVAARDRADMLTSWRDLAGSIERKLAEAGLQEGDQLIAAVRTFLERWLGGKAHVSEAIQLLLAGKVAAAQYALREDVRDRSRSAYHEAGHAVMAWFFGVEFRLVTLRPLVGLDIIAHVALHLPIKGTPVEVAERHALICLAGRASLEVARDTAPSCGAEQDEILASQLVLETRPLMGEVEANAFMVYSRIRAREILRRLWPAVHELADALIAQEELTGAAAEAIIERAVPGVRPPRFEQGRMRDVCTYRNP